MRPAGPVPGTNCSSMPRSHARRRTAGDAIGFSPASRAGPDGAGEAPEAACGAQESVAEGLADAAVVATGAAARFTQAGRSPFVSHARSDAEKGACGILEVLP